MKRLLLYMAALCCAVSVFASGGGFYLGQTRVVFPSDKKSVSLSVSNNDSNKDWLLRSWVSQYDDNNKSPLPFIITPPLYRLDRDNSIQLRINAVDVSKLPTDRESVFRINVMAIPPQGGQQTPGGEQENSARGSIQFALNSRIKLFYRPAALNQAQQVKNAWQELRVQRRGDVLTISNPTPYYLTLSHLKLNGVAVKGLSQDSMITPRGELTLPIPKNTRTFTWQTINDHGGFTAEKTVTF